MLPHDHSMFRKNGLILALLVVSTLVPPLVAAGSDTTMSPSLLPEIVAGQANQLATIDSDAGAMALFTTTVGPALGLNDAAAALGAKGLPVSLVKELGLASLAQSVHQLMAALAVWQLAEAAGHASEGMSAIATASAELPPTGRREWLTARSRVSALEGLLRALGEQPSGPGQTMPQTGRPELLLVAKQVALEAYQRATDSWWKLHGWKERVRQSRGQARLCGTWQWVIHNHQNHREQKTVMLFPPAGQIPDNVPLPAETVILGDAIYLRWEQDGRIQEDSLLFIKDGTRIEGSFVNNAGGWGSITGKRTAGCQP